MVDNMIELDRIFTGYPFGYQSPSFRSFSAWKGVAREAAKVPRTRTDVACRAGKLFRHEFRSPVASIIRIAARRSYAQTGMMHSMARIINQELGARGAGHSAACIGLVKPPLL